MKRTTYCYLFCSYLLFVPTLSFAWGWDGHKLICALAETQLTDSARKMVNQLLADGEELSGGAVDFPISCLWPDDVRYEDRKGTYEHHFINVPDDAVTVDYERDCAALTCTATGVQQALTYLGSETDGKREVARRAAALRFLGHYIGDVHQPMHVGNSSDWGGNKIKVTWYGKDSNLHKVWDYEMLEKMNVRYPSSLPFLQSIPVEQNSQRVAEWFNESLKLGRSNAYANVDGELVKNGDQLGIAYLNRNKPVLLQRLTLAAHRLANLLNAIAAGEQPRAFTLTPN